KNAGIAIHMLGLGREGELDENTMKELAKRTGGEYFRASNEKALIQIFEKLSNKIHDDGIDVATLTKLAERTEGKYYHAKDVEKLQMILTEVGEAVQHKEWVIKYPTLRQVNDGTRREVKLELVFRGQVVEEHITGVQVHGFVVAEMNYLTYLFLMGCLG